MATLSIALTNAGAANRTVSKTISAPHLTRFVAAYRGLLGKVPDGNGGLRDMTDAEVFDAWANAFFAGTRGNVLRYEQDAAAQVARDGITEIVINGG